MRDSIVASLALGVVMTLGDVAWYQFGIRHRVVAGVIHGAVMCLCLGLAIGVRSRRPLPALVAGPLIGVAAAASFYVLAPALRWGAMFPAWMLLWILFAMLQQWLDKREGTWLDAAQSYGTDGCTFAQERCPDGGAETEFAGELPRRHKFQRIGGFHVWDVDRSAIKHRASEGRLPIELAANARIGSHSSLMSSA